MKPAASPVSIQFAKWMLAALFVRPAVLCCTANHPLASTSISLLQIAKWTLMPAGNGEGLQVRGCSGCVRG